MSDFDPRALGQNPARPEEAGLAKLCAFRVGNEEYLIDIMRIREIVPPLKVTAVPRLPPFVEGVVNLRGVAVPVVDLRKRFELPVTPPTRRTKLLIVFVARRLVGLLVDQVIEVIRIERKEIRPAPGFPGGGPSIFVGVCGPTNRLRLLIDIKALLANVEPISARSARALALDDTTGATTEGETSG